MPKPSKGARATETMLELFPQVEPKEPAKAPRKRAPARKKTTAPAVIAQPEPAPEEPKSPLKADLLATTVREPEADPLKADFRNFLFVVWKHLGLPDPTPEQYDIAYYLQHGPKKKMIMAFRGVGKSWIYGAFICWRLYCNPDWKIMVVSASKLFADSLSIFVKKLISEMPMLQHLQPGKDQRDSNIMFDVGPSRTSKDPSVKSVGITGQITGSRADEILADDIESLNNSATQLQREKLLEMIKEFAAVIKPESGYITYLGTPQSENSIYNSLPERGYEIRIWPAEIPKDVEKYQGRLSPFILELISKGAKPGDPVSPRFGSLMLAEKQAEYGRSGYMLQFMLDTSLADADRYPLKISDLIVMALDPRLGPAKVAWGTSPDLVISDLPNVALQGDRYHRPFFISTEMAEYTGSVLAIDPSGRGKDETAYAVIKILHGNLFVTAWGGFKDGFSENTLKSLAVIAKAHQVNFVIYEANFGDGMFGQLFKPVLARIHPATVEEVKHSVQKERRIADTLEPLMNQHRLVFDRKVVEEDHRSAPELKYCGIYQMTRLTRDKGALAQDDRLDVLAIAVAYWIEHMARDSDTAHRDHLEELRKQELEKFMESTIGFKPNSGMTWI